MDSPSMPDTSEPAGESARRTPWLTIAVIYLGGVVAAMSFGKFSPVGPEVAGELGLSLSQLGWVISAVVGVGAAAGLPAGYLVRRVGAERSLVAGLALTAAASAASVAAPDFGWLLAARFAEGIGYLLIIITCPALVVRLATGRDRGTALSIWATFVPVGLGASTLAGGALASALGWRGWIALVAGLTLAMALVLWARLPRGPGRQAAGPRPRAGALWWPLVLAAAFCLAILVTLPVIVLLPTLLIEQQGYSAAAAGALTSAISVLSALGGLAVGVLLRRGIPVGALALTGLLTLPAAWILFGDHGSPSAALAGAAIVSIENGFLGALGFAALPLVLERLDHADVGNGVVAQAGSLGSLLGPPLFGLVAAGLGFGALVPAIAVGILAAIGLLLLVGRRASTRVLG
ncbi:CynX/NimT family MFS transporter [Nonomuraea sp. CA-218870]|uniref:MFS transporter n=1 Tax=Nonomuraea sp. CA-218870 TaxID=3239998 RepID=UPI003D8AB3B4